MKKRGFLVGSLLFFSILVEATPWVTWDSPEGFMRLQANHQTYPNLWKIVRFYETQRTLTYCGVAAAVMALNSLEIPSPSSTLLGKYAVFNQEEFFSEAVQKIVPRSEAEDRGFSLEKLADVLKIFPLEVSTYQSTYLSHEHMRTVMISALKNPKQRVLILYQRKLVEQEGSGHWSLLAAYDANTDSFLLMDVARFKYPPLWVEAEPLLNAMQTRDRYDQLRGFLVLEKQETAQS